MSEQNQIHDRHQRRSMSIVWTLLKRNTIRNIPVFGTDLIEYLHKTGQDGTL